jgi:oligoribonuclease NrnB/cAMP/cGMP phosphodiesterase (DHH superfamily)
MKKKELVFGWVDDDHISILWNVEDVQTQASIRNIKLTKDECRQVLDECLNSHDANIGISWDILDHHIWNLFGRRKGAAA